MMHSFILSLVLARKRFRSVWLGALCLFLLALGLPAQAQQLNLQFLQEQSGGTIVFDLDNIPASAHTVELRAIPIATAGDISEYPNISTRGSSSLPASATSKTFLFGRGYSPGQRVWIEAIAYDSNGKNVGYDTLTYRFNDSHSLSASRGTVGDFFFFVDIADMPSPTDTIDITVSQGGKVIHKAAHQARKNSPPFKIRIGNLWSDYFHPSRSLIKPSTSYSVLVEATDITEVLGRQTFQVTTTAERKCHKLGGASEYQNCPQVAINSENHSDTMLEFRITKVVGANYYRIPAAPSCGTEEMGGIDGHLSGLHSIIKWTPGENHTLSSAPNSPYAHPYTVRYRCLRPNTTFNIPILAYGPEPGLPNQYRLIAHGMHTMSTLAEPSPQQLGEGQQLAPTAKPSPTAIPPVYIEVDYHGNGDTDATLSWRAPSGYPAGYLLQVVGGNNEAYVFHLARSETSKRINGLTPGGDYTAYLTAYLRDGGKRTGEAHFGMADSPPTATPIPPTPIPPTSTPVPQQSSQDSVQQQQQQLQYSQMQSEDDEPQPSGPYASLISTLIGYQKETQHGDAHVERWTRALAALGWGSHANPMTLQEAKTMRDKYSTSRWQPVVDALTALQPSPTNTPVPPPPPTSTAIPPPPPEEPYTVPRSLINTLKGYQAETQHGDAHVKRWTRALAALGHISRDHEGHDDPMSLSEAEEMADTFTRSRWQPVIDALEKLAED